MLWKRKGHLVKRTDEHKEPDVKAHGLVKTHDDEGSKDEPETPDVEAHAITKQRNH